MPHTKSPLRYPGGKTQLWKFVNHTIKINNIKDAIYCEPFAGGAGVALELLLSNHVSEIIINDFDPAIYSFWNACLNHSKELIELIEKTQITIDEWFIQKENYKKFGNNPDSLEGAFATFFLNRTNVSGIISGGPIGGYKQLGKYKIDCRFTKATSIKKINEIQKFKDKIHLFNFDSIELMTRLKYNFDKDRLFIFFDPPYYQQGQSLYLSFFNHTQHVEVRDKIFEMDDYHWILTYDKAPQISSLYSSMSKSYEYLLYYSANKKRVASEYLFASPITKLESNDKVLLSGLNF